MVPNIAPILNHQGEEVAILISAPGVAFSLIPDCPSDTIADGGSQHAVVNITGSMIARESIVRPSGAVGNVLSKASSGGSGRLPCFQGGLIIAHGLEESLIRFGFFPAFQQRLIACIRLEKISAYPGFGSRSPPSIVDESNGDVQCLVKLPSEKIPDS